MQVISRRLAALALMALAAGGLARSGAAQQAQPSAAAIAAAQELLGALGAEKQFDAVMPMMLGQMRQVIIQANPNASKDIDEVLAALTAKFASRKGDVIPLTAQVYARRMSVEDMNAMTAFFKTPAGKRFVETLPQVTQESMMIGQQWGRKLGEEVERELRQELSKRGMKL